MLIHKKIYGRKSNLTLSQPNSKDFKFQVPTLNSLPFCEIRYTFMPLFKKKSYCWKFNYELLNLVSLFNYLSIFFAIIGIKYGDKWVGKCFGKVFKRKIT